MVFTWPYRAQKGVNCSSHSACALEGGGVSLRTSGGVLGQTSVILDTFMEVPTLDILAARDFAQALPWNCGVHNTMEALVQYCAYMCNPSSYHPHSSRSSHCQTHSADRAPNSTPTKRRCVESHARRAPHPLPPPHTPTRNATVATAATHSHSTPPPTPAPWRPALLSQHHGGRGGGGGRGREGTGARPLARKPARGVPPTLAPPITPPTRIPQRPPGAAPAPKPSHPALCRRRTARPKPPAPHRQREGPMPATDGTAAAEGTAAREMPPPPSSHHPQSTVHILHALVRGVVSGIYTIIKCYD